MRFQDETYFERHWRPSRLSRSPTQYRLHVIPMFLNAFSWCVRSVIRSFCFDCYLWLTDLVLYWSITGPEHLGVSAQMLDHFLFYRCLDFRLISISTIRKFSQRVRYFITIDVNRPCDCQTKYLYPDYKPE